MIDVKGILSQLDNIMQIFNIQLYVIREGVTDSVEWDYGIRDFFNISLDVRENIASVKKYYKMHTLYIIEDEFNGKYMSFRLPDVEGEPFEYVQIGPVLEGDAEMIARRVMDENQIPMIYFDAVLAYYNKMPNIYYIEKIESLVLLYMQYMFPEEEIEINRIGRYFHHKQLSSDEIIAEMSDANIMRDIELRYQAEDSMIQAVRIGDMEAVLRQRHVLEDAFDRDMSLGIEESKQLLLSQNTLMRKAVQAEAVHPFYIDRLSENMKRKISEVQTAYDLKKLGDEMVRKYCLLINNYSLRGYSEVVRKALNHIEFNLDSNLKLDDVAKAINVNSSYLSMKFKKEIGKNLTDYVNEKRVFATFPYLATTSMPIADIAEKVGILDVSYYIKLFKKYQEMTPGEYRKLMQK